MKKRTILLSAMLSVSCLGLGIFSLNQGVLLVDDTAIVAYAEPINGTCGENLTWTLDSEGVLTISGEGDMTDFQSTEEMPWYDYQSQIKQVIIQEGVTSIGDAAFGQCRSIREVTIPNGVTRIGSFAFGECFALGSVTIPDGVTSIGSYAFLVCGLSRGITIPSSVTSIGESAFNYCAGLKDVFYTGTEQQWNAIIIGSSNDSLASATIHYTGVIDGTCGENLTWTLNSEGTLTISGDGEMTENPWYRYRTLIKQVVIQEGVTSIGDEAFRLCSPLTTITIPDSVISIGMNAFQGCSSLTSINIPDSVTSIGDYAFYDCSNLTSINIPDSVTSIGDYAFYGCSNLASVEIGNGVTSIGSSAFYGCSSLTSVEIGNGVTSIGNFAFFNCSSLTSIVISDSVTSIGDGTFSLCSGLTDVYYTGTEAKWNEIVIGPDNTPLTSATKHYNYAKFDTASLILDGTLTVNFKMVANDLFVTNGGYAKVETTYYDGTFRDIERDYPLSALEVDGEGRYLLKVGMNPAQMNDNIRVTLYTGEDTSLSTVDYSVRQYCERRIQYSTNPEMVALAKAILNYGAATQEYVNYKTGTLANASLTSDKKAVVDNHTIYTDSEYSASATERIEGIANVSATLLLDSTTSIRFKVTLGSGANISDYVIKVNGVVCEAERNGDVYSIYVRNIAAHQLSNMYTLTIEKDEAVTTVRYGVWSYAQRVASAQGQKLMKAMQLYSEATLGYMN